jgi:hypothetical protein
MSSVPVRSFQVAVHLACSVAKSGHYVRPGIQRMIAAVGFIAPNSADISSIPTEDDR